MSLPQNVDRIIEPISRNNTEAQNETRDNTPTRYTNVPENEDHNMNTDNDNETHTHTQRTTKKKGLRKRANIKLGTLNINGLHTITENQRTFEKWAEINTTMKTESIAILAVQETHLDEQNTHEIQKVFDKRLRILNSQSETNPRTSAGVAFILNKDLIDTQHTKSYKLIKGRAIAIKIRWKNEEETIIINVYAPNKKSEHQNFWEEIDEERIKKNIRKPDFVLGDFNLTEEPIDRTPARYDNARATEALRDFRLKTGIQDQWRDTYPKAREFTYRAMHKGKPIKSRLDRIYISKNKTKFSFDWKIAPSSVPTDHWLVTVRYAPKGTPHIGKGRWTMPLKTVNNKNLMKRIEERGMELQQDLETLLKAPGERSEENNPQKLWKDFKMSIIVKTSTEAKISHHKCRTKIQRLNEDREKLLESPEFEENARLHWQEAIIANEIEHLEKTISHNNRERLKAKISLHGEKLGGIWSNLSKSKKPRDIIYRLRIPNTTPP